MQGKGNIAVPVTGHIFQAEHFLPYGVMARRVAFFQFTPRHHCDKLLAVDIADILGSHILAIPHDGDTVGHLKQFFQTVGYINNGNTLLFQIADDLEQGIYFVDGQRRRGLVHFY